MAVKRGVAWPELGGRVNPGRFKPGSERRAIAPGSDPDRAGAAVKVEGVAVPFAAVPAAVEEAAVPEAAVPEAADVATVAEIAVPVAPKGVKDVVVKPVGDEVEAVVALAPWPDRQATGITRRVLGLLLGLVLPIGVSPPGIS